MALLLSAALPRLRNRAAVAGYVLLGPRKRSGLNPLSIVVSFARMDEASCAYHTYALVFCCRVRLLEDHAAREIDS